MVYFTHIFCSAGKYVSNVIQSCICICTLLVLHGIRFKMDFSFKCGIVEVIDTSVV